MKLQQLSEQESTNYELRTIKISDSQGLQQFSEFYNEAGTLSWKLTPNRLKQKLGSRGRLWGLFIEGTDEMVGSIGLKTIKDDEGQSLAEMGYLMIAKGHGSLPNVMTLYKAALKRVKSFDAVFMTTDVKNRKINKLLDRSNKSHLVLMIKSPFSNNKLYVWQVGKSSDSRSIIYSQFSQHILQEY